MSQSHTITFHPEKEIGYQYKLTVVDEFSKMTIHFATEKDAERYVMMSMFRYGEII